MNDLRYFRNDKLDLVNKEKQRFGFRKLSSGKIASVLLGVTIFGSFALNGQVVKAYTTTDGSQTSAAVVKANNDSQTNAVVDEPTSTQNNKGQGATANKEEQSGQDTSAQNYGSHSSSTITSEGGEETTEAKTGNIQADSTGTDRGGTPSDKNGARVIRIARLAAMQPAAGIPVSDQPTAEKMTKKYTYINVDHAQKLLDYYNNIGTITKILGLNSSNPTYGGPWLEGIIKLKTDNVKTFTNDYVDRVVGIYTGHMVKDTQDKIGERIKNLQDLSSQYPNNQEIKDTINKLTDIKDSVTASNITNAVAMKDAIGALNQYGSKKAYDKLADDAAKNPEATNKDALHSDVAAADTVKSSPAYYNGSDDAKKAYEAALEKANQVLSDDNATQKEVEEAKRALESAKDGLKGEATNKDALHSDVDDSRFTKTNDKYYNASQDKKQAYDEAFAQATKLLNDKTASQKAVDDAVANLEKTKAELNGEPNFISSDYTPSELSTPSTGTPAENTTEKILMHASYLYDNKGIKIDKPTVKSYVTVVVAENPVTINGIKYYKVAGKDEYIKAGNIDGTLRVITHNSYIYNNKGKATRNKGIKRLVKKTRIVRTYGAPINIKGHMMYRIGKNRYIKARNFEGTLRRLSHNSFVYDENGKATRNKGIRRLLKKSRVVRTFDAPVKINGHMMYRVDNGYVKVKNFK